MIRDDKLASWETRSLAPKIGSLSWALFRTNTPITKFLPSLITQHYVAKFCNRITRYVIAYTRGADKTLARPGRKQAVPVKYVVVRGMDWFG